MVKELEEKINDVNGPTEIKLSGMMEVDYPCGMNFFIGKNFLPELTCYLLKIQYLIRNKA